MKYWRKLTKCCCGVLNFNIVFFFFLDMDIVFLISFLLNEIFIRNCLYKWAQILSTEFPAASYQTIWEWALALENSNAILFYHSKTQLYQYTIPFYNTSTSKNSIFIKILFFNPFFIISSQPFSLIFLGFSIAIFISLSQHRFNTQHTPIIHRSTYPNPSPHPHT